MGQFSGVIPEAVYKESNPMRRMVAEVMGGRTKPYRREEIEKIVNQRYFGYDSVASLQENEVSFLRQNMVDTLLNRFNKGTARIFVGTKCYQQPGQNGNLPHIYHKEALKNVMGHSDIRLMSSDEKLIFLENPENLDARWHEDWAEMSFAEMGYRYIDDYGITFAKTFTSAIRKLQAAKGKKELHILDLGGGVGQALNDIKKMHPEVVTYNATRDEEFSHYPTDFHVIGFMERLPRALEGKIDFIFSNMTTRYLAFMDLVIECCVAALSEGGIMDVFFSSERSDNKSEEDIRRRMKKAHDFLKDLSRSGKVKLKINHRYTSCVGGSFRSTDGTLYPSAGVFIKKLKV